MINRMPPSDQRTKRVKECQVFTWALMSIEPLLSCVSPCAAMIFPNPPIRPDYSKGAYAGNGESAFQARLVAVECSQSASKARRAATSARG